jgi:hypothetical protein
MARSEHWKKAVPLIQQWVECRFAKSGMSPWDYIDGRMNLGYVGIHRANFMKELAPLIQETKRQGWDDIDWWNHVNNRIYYFFHRASDKRPRKPCFAEWPGPIPPRPVKATTAPDVAAPPIPEELPLVAEGKGVWARLRGVFKGDQGDNLGPERDSETPPKEMR